MAIRRAVEFPGQGKIAIYLRFEEVNLRCLLLLVVFGVT